MSGPSVQTRPESPIDRETALNDRLDRWFGSGRWATVPASSDASFRRYFRVTTDDGTYIVMDAPPAYEDTERFVRIARQFRGLGLNVPAILQSDTEHGFLLLSDLGDRQYLPELRSETADAMYGDAVAAIIRLQQADDHGRLPPYDEKVLRRELGLFHEWFLTQYLELTVTDETKQMLEDVYGVLIQNALEQPQVIVHRDFHSRNLMVTEDHNPGVLDFQDALFGPITYDVVSLYRDCYIDWPQAKIDAWLADYLAQLSRAGVGDFSDTRLFQRWFDFMGMQRHLKCVGIFSRLWIRDSKTGYLKDIPRTFNYIVDVLQRQQHFPAFDRYVREVVHPVLKQKTK